MSEWPPPGWYPVPGSPRALRWWDGNRWTGETREADAGTRGPGQPAAADVTGQPAAADVADQAADAAPGPPGAPGPAPWRAPALAAWEARTAPAPPRRARRGGWLGRFRRR